MNEFKKRWFKERLPLWGARFLRFWSRLVRTRVYNMEPIQQHQNVVYAHWHGDELALLPYFGHMGVTVMVSTSRDGDIMARAARSLGYRVARGSSTRGAVGGLVALIRTVRQGRPAVLAVDGPQGPRGVCKPGIVRLAQKTNVPLFVVGVAVTSRFVFKKSWNRAYLPLPLARQAVWFEGPLYFPPKADQDALAGFCRQVEEALNRASRNAEKALARRLPDDVDPDGGAGQTNPDRSG